MDKLGGCLATIVILGGLTGLANFVGQKAASLGPRIADGRAYLWVSGAVFAVFALKQVWDLRALLTGRNPRLSALGRWVVGGVGGACLAGFLVLNVLARTGSPSTRHWIASNTTGFVAEGDGILALVWIALVSLYLSIVVATLVFCALFLGSLATGASLAIATHNLLNGGAFQPGLIVQAIFDFGVSGVWSVIITVTWFLVSTFVVRRFASDVAV